MIRFEIPDSVVARPINAKLVCLMKNNPEMFYENLFIESAFGCPYGCEWNGGCLNMPCEEKSENTVNKIFDFYEKIGITYRITFTNRLLSAGNLKNTYGNMIAKIGERKGNAIIVATDLMKNYIEKTFPKYEIIQSISRVYKTVEEVQVALNKNMVCIPIWLNKDFEKLQIMENRQNIIILVNEYCPVAKCEYCDEHYDEISKYILKKTDLKYICKRIVERKEYEKSGIVPIHIVSPKDYVEYERIGIEHFKINGRASNEKQLMELYCFYFAKEQYREKIAKQLIKNNA
mgnify:CR=1 FL=1